MPDEAPDVQDTPSDEQPAAPTDGTPAESPEDSQTASVDYEKRYSDLRPEFDRTKQQLSQYEQFIESLQNEETQAQALQALGLALEGQDDDDEYADPDDVVGQRLERVESFLQEQADREAQAEVEGLTNAFLEQELDKIDPDGKFTDDYVQLVVALADDYADEDGLPDVAAAHKALDAQFEAQRKNYVKSKRTAQAPSGASPSHKPDLSDPEQRRDYMARLAADIDDAA